MNLYECDEDYIHTKTLGYTRLRFYDINLRSFEIAYHEYTDMYLTFFVQILEVSENIKFEDL